MPEATETVLQALSEPLDAVNAFMAEVLAQRPMPKSLRAAAEYSLLGPGKRMRPVLVIRACEAVGGSMEDALPAAAAIEMIHAFSLIHDDLPAMDDDDMRRGRPTLHKHANEPMAILAGDLLTGLAFETVATRVNPAKRSVAVSRELAVATNDMISGQVYDTLHDFPKDMELRDQLVLTHMHKTGALIRCACRMGGICGGASGSALNGLSHYAESIGLMFQVVDDLLDVTQSAEQMGKATNKDADSGKLTYPGLIGMEASRDEVKRLLREALEALDPLGPPADPLRQLAEYMAVREK